MILVRLVFQSKSGSAGDVVDQFRQNAEMVRRILGPDVRTRILTDLSGPFDTVVQEMEVESLAEWERLRAATFSNPEFQNLQGSGESPFASGRTEL